VIVTHGKYIDKAALAKLDKWYVEVDTYKLNLAENLLEFMRDDDTADIYAVFRPWTDIIHIHAGF
jgi:hypothetical protein